MKRKKPIIEDAALIKAREILSQPEIPADDLLAEYSTLTACYKKLLQQFNKTLVISDSYEVLHKEFSNKLEKAAHKYLQIKEGALPICMYCKKIRSDDDYWQRLETFFSTHADIMFSHGICPDCIKTAYRQMGVFQRNAPLPGVGDIAVSHSGQIPAEDDALKEMRALLKIHTPDDNPFTPDVERFVLRYEKLLRRFNKIVSISDAYQSQLMEYKTRLELMARTDLLTGLANRWEMMARLESEKSRAERHGTTFSVLVGDIDHFKAVNDSHGHLAGDRVLRAIAETLRSNIRTEDTCSRWGGEEFLLILPETDQHNAGAVAEKLLAEVRGTTVVWEGRELGVTMSIGCGGFTPGMSIDDCITLADDALYRAKAAGRDRFAVATG